MSPPARPSPLYTDFDTELDNELATESESELANEPDAASALLRAVGLRVTRPRLGVLHAVEQRPHADTATIITDVRTHLESVSEQAVYDCLNALTDAGLLRRIQPPGSVARYEARTGDNHHHLVCERCAVVVDVDCAIGAAPCLDAADDHGFVITAAEVIYRGLCPTCVATPI